LLRLNQEEPVIDNAQVQELIAPAQRRLRLGAAVRGRLQEGGLVLAFALVVLVFSILRPNTFQTLSNMQTILSSQAVILVLAIAFMVPLITGELDLSLAGVLGISNVLIGWFNVNHGWPIWLAVAAAVLIGALIGVVNGVLVVKLKLPSIVVTLGTGTLLAGLALGITTTPITGLSTKLVSVVRFQMFGLQSSFYIALVMTIAVWYVLTYTPIGRYLYFVGAGETVARLAGLRVDRLKIGAFVAGGAIAGLGGVLLVGLLGAADPNSGPNLLLPGLASVFLGATAFTPGRYNTAGSFVAVYFLVTGITGLELLGYSGWVSSVFYGGSLVVAVALSRLVGVRKAT
jgi:ribose transport system permease protein